MTKRNILISIGFLLFLLGLVSLFLGLSGIVLTILKPIEYFGVGAAFGIKILMVLFGFVFAYLGYLDETDDEED